MTLLAVWHAYVEVLDGGTDSPADWCRDNFLNARNLQRAADIRTQLADLCTGANSTGRQPKDDVTIRKALAGGLYLNSASRSTSADGQYVTMRDRQLVNVHPASVLRRRNGVSGSSYIVYSEMVETTKLYVRHVTYVDPTWLRDLAPDYYFVA